MPLIEELKLEFEREIIIIPIGHGEKYEDWISSSSTSFNFPEFDENRTATLFYTTGTTGDPKGVTYSHRQLVLHTLGLLAGFGSFSGDSGLHRDDVYMPLTPLFHVHGWGFPYAATMLGLRQVYPNRYDPETILQLIDSEAVTFSHCVPTVLSMLLDHPNSKKVNLSRWKVIIGGSALSKSLQSRASKFGIRLHAAYGMSETCPFLTVADLSSTDPDAQSQTGFPGPLVDLRVVSPNMQDVPHDGLTTGEIVVKAPWLTNGYMDNPKASKDLWRNSYLHTGDVGYIRENGSLQVTDRLKDVIKTGGEWISSLTLENIASSCSNIEEVAAIGIPNEKWGERAVLVVKLSNNANPDLVRKDLMRKFREHFELGEISKWAIPDNIFFVEQLPKTSVGKLDKKVMRKYVLTLNETNNDR
jgi:fatty-acyl-CoA synthase